MSVSITGLSYTYPGSDSPALRSITCSIGTGEYLAVLGANGSGKSTLARCITGLLVPDAGTVTIDDEGGVPTALVFQSPGDQIVAETVELDTAFGLENLAVPRDVMKERVPRALDAFRLASRAGEASALLSTGNKQLLALAGVHVLESAVLVLDEPTSMLSPVVRAELLDYLDTRHQSGGTIIHITHDRDEAARAGRVLVMEDGAVVFDGTPRELHDVSGADQERWGISARFPEKPVTRTMEDGILECRDLCEGPLENFSARFPRGSVTAITGESGSGKSTLLEVLAGLRVPDSGTVTRAADAGSALAVQESEASLFAEFVADDVAYGPRNAGLSGKTLVERVSSAMDAASLPFAEFKDRQTFSLSGGERRKAALAGIIALDTPVILLDEPSSALDVRSRAQLLELIVSLASRGKTVIFSTNREEECRLADQVITLQVPDSYRVRPAVKKKLDKDQQTIERLRQGETGSYEKGTSVYHGLSPAGKYLCTISAITAALAAETLPVMLAVLALELITVLCSRYPLVRLGRGLLKILPWIALIAVMQYAVFRGQSVNPVFLLRFIALFIPLSVFVFITSHTEIMYGVEDLLKPLNVLRVPVRDLSLLTGIVFRFIPLLYTEAGRIARARIIRKAGRSENRGRFHGLRSMASLFVPLVIRTLARAEHLAEAVTARYYGSGNHTRYFYWTSGLRQHVLVAFSLLLAAGIVFLSIISRRGSV